MSTSAPVRPNARPVPSHIDSSAAVAGSAQRSPRSPLSSTSPLSAQSDNNEGYFSRSRTSNDWNIMDAISRARSKSPLGRSRSHQQTRSVSDTAQPRSPTGPPPARTFPQDSAPATRRPRPVSHTYSDVGRHSNEWIFNGFSVRDAMRKVISRDDPKSP
ncbi:MAG: hypothetical protein M1833_003539 [Piccolia ochrophora]|nr:MAG: hypothetical protein M1833_003539 [Piccolia ochrophora]